jgi:hypothetical protein
MDSRIEYHQRLDIGSSALEEQILYDHLLACVETESPERVLLRFRQLFIEAAGYAEVHVWRALQKIVLARDAERNFKFVLNRCCYILINRWLMQPRLHGLIPQLIDLLAIRHTRIPCAVVTRKLREFVQQFGQSEQYRALQRLAELIMQTDVPTSPEEQPLKTLIRRYPYLYEHSLLTIDTPSEQRQKVKLFKLQVQRQFEVDLSRYITDRRRSQVQAVNPTLLSDRQLDIAIDRFGGKVDGTNTARDLARQFRLYTNYTRTYRAFKAELYEYVVKAVDPKYGKHRFNQKLYTCLQDIMPHRDDDPLDENLIANTCRKLLNFLVVESPQRPNHSIFVDLTSNLGIDGAMALVMKIVMVCDRVKAYLEHQFSTLFKLYEAQTRGEVTWLVEALEHLNVAFSLNFGMVSLNNLPAPTR